MGGGWVDPQPDVGGLCLCLHRPTPHVQQFASAGDAFVFRAVCQVLRRGVREIELLLIHVGGTRCVPLVPASI